MIVKAKTEYTLQLLKKIARFNAFKNQGKIVYYCILELIILCMAALSILLVFTSEKSEDIVFLAVCAVIIAFVVPLFVLLLPSLSVKMSKYVIGAENLYQFTEDEILIESTLPLSSGQTKANYAYFHRIYETREMFYLYISKRQAFILKKSDIIEGSVSDLKNLFISKLPKNKYIVKGM